MDPVSRGFASMIRHFSGLNDQERKLFRQAILAMDAARMQNAFDYLRHVLERAAVAVYAGEDRLSHANRNLHPPLVVEPLMGSGEQVVSNPDG
jgi:Zn-dependent M16 (insulinase) family peptidase